MVHKSSLLWQHTKKHWLNGIKCSDGLCGQGIAGSFFSLSLSVIKPHIMGNIFDTEEVKCYKPLYIGFSGKYGYFGVAILFFKINEIKFIFQFYGVLHDDAWYTAGHQNNKLVCSLELVI